MYLALCVLLVVAFVPAVYAEPWSPYSIERPRAAVFEMPDKLDGFATGRGCDRIVLPEAKTQDVFVYEKDDKLVDPTRDPWDDNGTLIYAYDKAQLLVSQGAGETLIMHGDQVPQWTSVCKYAGRNYVVDNADYYIRNSSGTGHFFDPFTGFHHTDFNSITSNPFSSNPFEYMGYSSREWPGKLIILTDQGYQMFGIAARGAMSVVAEYRPLDSTLNLRVEGIYKPYVGLQISNTPDFFDFDSEKYDGGILVNGQVTPIGPAFIPKRGDSFTIDVKDEEWARACWYLPSSTCLSVTANMTEQGWSELSRDAVWKKASEWYHQMYDQDYLKEYGQIPEPDYRLYLPFSLKNRGLVTYHDATLDIEIPLKMNNNYTYTKNYPDMGWCRAPMVLVAKSSEDLLGACVMPDTAQTLIDRKWAQKMPELSEQKHRELARFLAYYGLQHVPGTADPHDAFKAALLGLPHVDDVHVLETTPGFSYRDKDYAKHYDQTEYKAIKYLKEAKPGFLDSLPYIWNSPEPIDDEIVCMRKTSNYKYPDEACPPSVPAMLELQ